jgi:HNH endonuclease
VFSAKDTTGTIASSPSNVLLLPDTGGGRALPLYLKGAWESGLCRDALALETTCESLRREGEMRLSKEATHRFLGQFRVGDGCWPWTGCTSKRQGYGLFYNRGHGVQKTTGAHRYSYKLFVGPLPKRLTIDHLCRVRNCVRPDHLEAVTNRENIMRGFGAAAIQAHKTHCKYGHPFSGYNLIIRFNGDRQCRLCWQRQERDRRRRKRLLEAHPARHRE